MSERIKKWIFRHKTLDMVIHWAYYVSRNRRDKANAYYHNYKEMRRVCRDLSRKASISAIEREREEKHTFSKQICFSILVPLYNTHPEMLRAMIQSVKDQTYKNWELCLADGSDKETIVGDLCQWFQAQDKRIRYQKLEHNNGIAENTNAAAQMASGDYLALLDHDDILHPSALYECMKAICEQEADFIYSDENTFRHHPKDAYNPHFKPDFAPDTLRSINYICHFSVFQRTLFEEVGGALASRFDGSQDYDLILRLTEKAKKIVHIPRVLYYWRASEESTAESIEIKEYVIDAAKAALQEHLKRIELKGIVEDSVMPSAYRIRYEIEGEPLVSIMIPNKDHVTDLQRCVQSIREKSSYSNWEIVIIENNSTKEETFLYYKELQKDSRIRVIRWKGPFNYSAINNFGFRETKGKHIILLNNDTEVISPDWIQEMLMFSQREDIGAVGAKLYYPDHRIQHAGLGIGILTVAGHYHRYFDGNSPGYFGRLVYAQNVSAVTAACMMIPRHVYAEMNGLDESFEIALNDVDLCMRIRKAGYLIVFTPFAELTHYESISRGKDDDTPEKKARFSSEIKRFTERWAKELEAGDPYYNPNLSVTSEDFTVRK